MIRQKDRRNGFFRSFYDFNLIPLLYILTFVLYLDENELPLAHCWSRPYNYHAFISSSNSSVDNQSVSYDNSQSLTISDVELGFKLVTESNSNNYRLRRIIEINDSLKDVMHKFLVLRENSLVLDQSKSFYSDKDPHYSITCSDYYVFALRHILI